MEVHCKAEVNNSVLRRDLNVTILVASSIDESEAVPNGRRCEAKAASGSS